MRPCYLGYQREVHRPFLAYAAGKILQEKFQGKTTKLRFEQRLSRYSCFWTIISRVGPN